MELKIGQEVHFYRDKGFPGKRGPYAARITAVTYKPNNISKEEDKDRDVSDEDGDISVDFVTKVNVIVQGDIGGFWHEQHIPILIGQFEDPGTRYCTTITE